jgi:hypothetical protein
VSIVGVAPALTAVACRAQEAVVDSVPDSTFCLCLCAFTHLHFAAVEVFMKQYNMTCKYAANRLKLGVPATVYHGGVSDGADKGRELKIFHVVRFRTASSASADLLLSLRTGASVHHNNGHLEIEYEGS